jgi:hypothetical protein
MIKMNINPLVIIKDAIKAVPSIKYALGILGIAAVISIVGLLRLDYKFAFIGIVLMFPLMVILLVFAKLTGFEDSAFNRPAIVLLWFSVIATISISFCLFFSVFFRTPLDLTHWIDNHQIDYKSELHSISIRGEIRDRKSNERITDKQIYITIDSYDFEAYSDSMGKFHGIIKSPYFNTIILRATHPDYKSVVVSKTIDSKTATFKISMQIKPY